MAVTFIVDYLDVIEKVERIVNLVEREKEIGELEMCASSES